MAQSQPSRRSLHPAEALLALAHPPATAASLFKSSVALKPLPFLPQAVLDPSSTHDARARRRKQRQAAQEARLAKRKGRASGKPKPLSARERRVLGVHKMGKEEKRWELFVPLWGLWVEYMRGLLGVDADDDEERMDEGEPTKTGSKRQYVSAAGGGPLLASADFHGAYLEVVQSRCVSRVGLRGIVVKDTKFTFEMITKENELKGTWHSCFT